MIPIRQDIESVLPYGGFCAWRRLDGATLVSVLENAVSDSQNILSKPGKIVSRSLWRCLCFRDCIWIIETEQEPFAFAGAWFIGKKTSNQMYNYWSQHTTNSYSPAGKYLATAGAAFSFDPSLPSGSRVVSASVIFGSELKAVVATDYYWVLTKFHYC